MTETPLSPRRLLSLLQRGEMAEDKGDVLKALRQYVEDRVEVRPQENPEEMAQLLRDRYERFGRGSFEPGDLVKWKVNLKNRRRPAYNEPAIVVEMLSSPVLDHHDEPSTPYFREPLDLVLGLIDEDGDFLCFHFDSRRFQRFNES